jgi:REP element-mobilizing transposase RayT
MVVAYHVIISAYGFWLPNDPRGSWSDVIRKWELLRFGPATKVRNNEFVAHRPHDRALREAAKEALDYPPVRFTDEQIQVIGRGFANYVEKSGVTFWAVSILDDHLHAVFLRHRYKSEQVANLLKGEMTKALVDAGMHPFAKFAKQGEPPPPCWGRKWWTVYVDKEDHLRQAIPYVERNPEKEGKPRQTWDFVVPYPLTFAEWRAGQRLPDIIV